MKVQELARGLIANWVLVSFLSALVVAIYVKYKFDIDYFEKYRSDSDTKKMSKFYQQMGDRLMASSEWEAAIEAYEAALKLSPNNTAATFGIVKAKVFEPLPGKDYCPPEMFSQFPDDYQMYFLKAIRCNQKGSPKEAKAWLEKCIRRDPKFVGPYLQLGDMYYAQGNSAEALRNYANAVKSDPNSAQAMSDLAACHMVQDDLLGARENFEMSYSISQSPITALALSETYWVGGNVERERALELHTFVCDYVSKNYEPKDRYIGGGWTSGLLPEKDGEVDTIGTVGFITQPQMLGFVRLETAIDYALLEKFEAAGQEFEACTKLSPSKDQRGVFQNRIRWVLRVADASPATKTWLEEHSKLLD